MNLKDARTVEKPENSKETALAEEATETPQAQEEVMETDTEIQIIKIQKMVLNNSFCATVFNLNYVTVLKQQFLCNSIKRQLLITVSEF